MHAPAIAGNSVLLLLRLVLGGLFVFAGSLKIADPQAFAFAIKGYDLLDPVGQGGLMAWLAFALPWTEVISGALLVVGARPRAAATVVAGLLAVFTGGYVSVLARGMSVECGCFGSSEFLCSGPIAACHLVRNGVMLAAAVLLAVGGGGYLAMDAKPAGEPAEDPEDDVM